MIATAYPDSITFALCAVVIVAGALGVVLSRNPVRAALNLVMTLFGVAVLFVELSADFLAVVQIIIYAGAIVVLFLFVIMLLGIDKREKLGSEPLALQRTIAIVVGLAFLGMIIGYGWGNFNSHGSYSVIGVAKGGDRGIIELAKATFSYYLLPFEVTSVLLVIAIIGAVVLIARSGHEDQDGQIISNDQVEPVDGDPKAVSVDDEDESNEQDDIEQDEDSITESGSQDTQVGEEQTV